MTTAQDQQSRELLPCPFCGREAMMSHSRDGEVCNVRCAGWSVGNCLGAGPNCYTEADAVAGWNRRVPVEQAARALPASMKPVAEIFAGDLFRVNQGPDAEPVTGDHDLYTAAQVLAMLAQGLAPGWQAVPVEPSGDMLVAIMSAGEVDVLRETPEKHQVLLIDRAGIPERYANLLAAAPQPPAAPATTEPQAPTTGAGSVTAGAAPAYRLLQRDIDTIQADDEFLRDDAVTWQADPQGIFVGMAYMSNVLRPARRAIESCPEVK